MKLILPQAVFRLMTVTVIMQSQEGSSGTLFCAVGGISIKCILEEYTNASSNNVRSVHSGLSGCKGKADGSMPCEQENSDTRKT